MPDIHSTHLHQKVVARSNTVRAISTAVVRQSYKLLTQVQLLYGSPRDKQSVNLISGVHTLSQSQSPEKYILHVDIVIKSPDTPYTPEEELDMLTQYMAAKIREINDVLEVAITSTEKGNDCSCVEACNCHKCEPECCECSECHCTILYALPSLFINDKRPIHTAVKSEFITVN